MEEQMNEGVLVYTSESKGFKYTEGSYELTGSYVTIEDASASIDGGSVNKEGRHIGNFYVRFQQGVPKVSLNNVPATDFIAVYNCIESLLEKLAE